MARIDEQVRRIRQEMQGRPEHEIRACISELHRREAIQAVGKVAPVVAPVKDWHDALLRTETGKQIVQAKLERELKADAMRQAHIETAERIRQLKELVHDVFVVQPRSAEPINGWRPRVRFDIYQRSKDFCRKLGQTGGANYSKVITTVKYAMTNSKSYRDAIEALGL